MSTSIILLIKDAVVNTSKHNLFRNRWVCLTSLEISIRRCYNFNNDFPLNRIALSKAISKLDSSVDNIKINNQSGIYRGYNSHEQYIFVQSLNDEPPEFPNPKFERN